MFGSAFRGYSKMASNGFHILCELQPIGRQYTGIFRWPGHITWKWGPSTCSSRRRSERSWRAWCGWICTRTVYSMCIRSQGVSSSVICVRLLACGAVFHLNTPLAGCRHGDTQASLRMLARGKFNASIWFDQNFAVPLSGCSNIFLLRHSWPMSGRDVVLHSVVSFFPWISWQWRILGIRNW